MDAETTVRQVVAVVADQFRIGVRDLLGDDRRRVVVDARWMAIEIAGRLTGCSGRALARMFGFDPTTLMHARRRLRQRLQERLDLAGMIGPLEKRCERAVSCPSLERCLRDQFSEGRDHRVLDELARRLRSDWSATIAQLDHHLFGGARHAA